MKKLSMRITDFPYEILQLIMILLAKSSEGAEGLARTITVCKHFLKFGDDKDVLGVANFDHVELSDVGVELFQCNNSLIKTSAQHGSVSAQYLLAKVILSSSSQVSTVMLNNYLKATRSGPDIPASCFAYSKGKQLSTSELVRLFIMRCGIFDFASMFRDLMFYLFRCSYMAGSVSFSYSMTSMLVILGRFTIAGLQEGGRWCYDPETQLLPTEFDTQVISLLRNRFVRCKLDLIEIQRECKDMEELSIALGGHGNEEGKEGVLDLGESFFRHIVGKYFDENVRLLDPNVLLSNSSFKLMKELCVQLAKDYEMHRSNAVKALAESFPSDRLIG